MSSKSYESGLQPYRTEAVRESTRGVAPSNPAWILFSDNVRSFEPSVDAGIEPQEGLGDPNYTGAFAGTEEAEVTVTYDLQQWLIDGSGNAQDPSYDGVARDSDNRLPNTHTVVRRMDLAGLDGSNSINGSTSKDTRQYVVGKGGAVDEVTFTANIDSGQPVLVELTYVFEKLRWYQIDQPPSDGTGKQIAVKSTDANDTTQSVTIQGVDDSDAAAEESVTLSGTTLVDTDTQFQEIDAIELDAETVGDVEVYEDDDNTVDTTTQGDQLAVLYGQSSYDQGEGDLGVPALGTGSHASAIGGTYELPLDGDSFERPSGTAIADNVTSHELSFSNNVDPKPTEDGPRPTLSESGQDAEASISVFGQTETYQAIVEELRSTTSDYVWTLTAPSSGDTGSITLSSVTVVTEPASEEARQDAGEPDLTLGNAQGVTIA